jgi:hypothetical protein
MPHLRALLPSSPRGVECHVARVGSGRVYPAARDPGDERSERDNGVRGRAGRGDRHEPTASAWQGAAVRLASIARCKYPMLRRHLAYGPLHQQSEPGVDRHPRELAIRIGRLGRADWVWTRAARRVTAERAPAERVPTERVPRSARVLLRRESAGELKLPGRASTRCPCPAPRGLPAVRPGQCCRGNVGDRGENPDSALGRNASRRNSPRAPGRWVPGARQDPCAARVRSTWNIDLQGVARGSAARGPVRGVRGVHRALSPEDRRRRQTRLRASAWKQPPARSRLVPRGTSARPEPARPTPVSPAVRPRKAVQRELKPRSASNAQSAAAQATGPLLAGSGVDRTDSAGRVASGCLRSRHRGVVFA